MKNNNNKLYDAYFDVKKASYAGSFVARNIEAGCMQEARNKCLDLVMDKIGCHAFHIKAVAAGSAPASGFEKVAEFML